MKRVLVIALLVIIGVGAWTLGPGFFGEKTVAPSKRPVPAVAVAAEKIRKGPIALRRTFNGALEAGAKFVVAPKVSGRVEFLAVDIGDRVRQGQLVARLDHEEFLQAVTQAEADLAVALANQTQAESERSIAGRELRRIETLRKRGVSSESQLDAAQSRQMAAGAGVAIARAQVTRAKAALETARIRLAYTDVTADWSGTDQWRVVAENFVAEGDTVSANSPLVSIVDLSPLTCVIFVTETDYGRLEPGQHADLTTAAFAGSTFSGRVSRIAPVFREATRQARVELTVDNQENTLKPGMFIRASLVLASVPDAVIVPETALLRRNAKIGVFLIRDEDLTVTWTPVTLGIRSGDQVQVSGLFAGGRVVTLGQHMLDNGSKVTLPSEDSAE